MELKNFIKTYDNLMPFEALSCFIRYINTINVFEKSALIGTDANPGIVDESVRRVQEYNMSPVNNSLTEVHWSNFLAAHFHNRIQHYLKECSPAFHVGVPQINNMTILKYEEGGFYKYHHDHARQAPRTLSLIYLLNNDYKGGELTFTDPHKKEEFNIDVLPNRLIIWPSVYLFPHKVNPIKEGKRYSIVSWAL